MNDKEMSDFSWTTLFFVTGLSFFVFSGIIKIMNGDHFEKFMITGIVALVLGCISFLGSKLTQSNSK